MSAPRFEHERNDETRDAVWGVCRHCFASEEVAWSEGDECPVRLRAALTACEAERDTAKSLATQSLFDLLAERQEHQDAIATATHGAIRGCIAIAERSDGDLDFAIYRMRALLQQPAQGGTIRAPKNDVEARRVRLRVAAEEAMHELLHIDASMRDRAALAERLAEALRHPWPPYEDDLDDDEDVLDAERAERKP